MASVDISGAGASFTPTLVSGATDGTLQVTKADGTFGTLLLGGTGATTGIKIIPSNNTLNLADGDGTLNNVLLKMGSFTAANNSVVNNSNNNGSGLELGSPSGGIFLAKLATALTYQVQDANTGLLPAYIQNGRLTVAKTANYTCTFADFGTHFTNAGAAGSVAFTLPTAQQGLWYAFTCVAAQVLTVSGGAASVFGPGSLTGATRTITGTTASAQYSSFEVVCYDGTSWVVRKISGTVT